jgi:beta-phosphoglucomutase-like phosphatase (HAD superfamily)
MPIGVIFDMDGVLVDSGPAHHQSWQILARRHGREVSAERFATTFGRPSRDIIRVIWGDSVSDEEVARLDADKEAIYRELIRGRVPLMPGCRETLAALHAAGLRLAVATSGPPENLKLVLREGGLGTYFAVQHTTGDVASGPRAGREVLSCGRRFGKPTAGAEPGRYEMATVHGFDIARGKPAPDCFLLAATRLGLAPAECVVVEDAPVGIEAGLAAGMPVIALAGTHPVAVLIAAGAARVVKRLDEITPELVRQVMGVA